MRVLELRNSLVHIVFYFMNAETWACTQVHHLCVLSKSLKLSFPISELQPFQALMRTVEENACKCPIYWKIFIHPISIYQGFTVCRYCASLIEKLGGLGLC